MMVLKTTWQGHYPQLMGDNTKCACPSISRRSLMHNLKDMSQSEFAWCHARYVLEGKQTQERGN